MVTRPVLRYHGGKWRLAPWILEHFPSHRVYNEPYGGGASVLLRKERSYAEVYNDLDGEVVNLFRVLRDPAQARELVRLVKLTPFSRDEFEVSYLVDGDPIEQARRTLFRSFAGYGSTLTGKFPTGFRGNVTRSGTIPAHDWKGLPTALENIVERLRGVVIENRPAIEVIKRYDTPKTLHYIDPPYPYETRSERWAGKAYRHEMSDDDHRCLADVLRRAKGLVVVSGYACGLYDIELYHDWERVDKETYADGAERRTESLWLSPRTSKILRETKNAVAQIKLFTE